MGGSRKSKRITWAAEVNLCQVRLFSSAKPPSEVGIASRLGGCEADESLPPGFEDMKPKILKLPQKTFSKWRCPPRFEVNREWQVVSGEESKEIVCENQRERRVLEAIYPQPSAIPPNPRLPVNPQESIGGDHCIPLIPLTPIEDADAALAVADSNPMIPQPAVSSQCSDIAQAALAAVLSNVDRRNLIDTDLLIRILTSPNLVQQLLTTGHAAQETPPIISTQHVPTTETNAGGALLSAPQITKPELTTCCPPDVSSTQSPPCMAKDISYYKSLIQQHGASGGGPPRQSCGKSKRVMGATTQEYAKSREVLKSRACMYFNTPRGCRNGANCAYQHDVNMLSSSRKRMGCVREVVGAKRVKLGR
ncbi:zinc finger CCCH domain-containing protein 6-like isoform X1 [Salvia miltiorrhiza]|uniref:zinc finger CCCH domain-containing protein 6-like isoform X1 n=1 Tax=Salvia miltiorrhiza TaxID=226208 RepID=UPI0025ABA68F|nr:zinc finger CCCH domain-containing protein 6-like isoform X1 [Salvia miltiorrhiza]